MDTNSSDSISSYSDLQTHWIQAQESLRSKLITEDDYTWRLFPARGDDVALRHVGGVDISFSKDDTSLACAALVVLDMESLEVVYDDYSVVRLTVPYVPGFLAFRELHHVDGLTQSRVRQILQAGGNFDKEIVALIGDSGQTWGAAMRSTQGSLKPIFISTGHRISLDTAVKIAKITCKYRVPEPIRQADIRSRDYLRKHQGIH